MLLDAIEAHVPQAPADARDRVGPILRVGIPTTGGKILRAARDAGYSVLFSTNAFMVRDGNGDVVGVRRPDPKQFAGLDAALDILDREESMPKRERLNHLRQREYELELGMVPYDTHLAGHDEIVRYLERETALVKSEIAHVEKMEA